jgi:hypothetical protein
VSIFRIAAVILFLFAAVGAFGWGNSWTVGTVLGLLALGLACLAAAGLSAVQLPARP